MWVFPSLYIIFTILCINLIGDGLRDAFDPRSQRHL
jgi:peptide/nickel transport system permease protein